MKSIIQIISNLSSEQIALISVIVTILLYLLGKHNELKFKKHELKKEKYLEFVYMLKEIYLNGGNIELNDEWKEKFFEFGSTVFIYGSKKMYKKYCFFREFSSKMIKNCKYYSSDLSLYLVADMLNQVRREIGMYSFELPLKFNSISFYTNDIYFNPKIDLKWWTCKFKVFLIKFELFLYKIEELIFIRIVFNLVMLPFKMILIIIKCLIMIPLGRLLLNLKIDKVIEKKLKNNKNITFWPSPGGEGAEVIYALRNKSTLADTVLNEIEKTGQVVRKTYQRRLPSNTSKDYYFIHRDTGKTEPIIVEYGFLDTTSDANRLKSNYKEYADAVVKAVASYIGVPYISDSTYIVKSGDSLYSIAKKYNTTVDEIKKLNNLTSNSLSIGQILNIPLSEVVLVNEYIVKSGDSLYSIANKYNTTVNELKSLNNLSSNTLSISQVLKLPKVDEIVTVNEYIVKSGDSLYSIAKKYNTSVDELKSLNNLTTNMLSIGQKLNIPVIEEVSNVYTVKSGDNLYSIARKFNTTVNDIKSKNNLSSNTLSIGQKLII